MRINGSFHLGLSDNTGSQACPRNCHVNMSMSKMMMIQLMIQLITVAADYCVTNSVGPIRAALRTTPGSAEAQTSPTWPLPRRLRLHACFAPITLARPSSVLSFIPQLRNTRGPHRAVAKNKSTDKVAASMATVCSGFWSERFEHLVFFREH